MLLFGRSQTDNKERFGRGGVLTAGGVKCKFLAMSTAGFVPKQEGTWLTHIIGGFFSVSLVFFPSWDIV